MSFASDKQAIAYAAITRVMKDNGWNGDAAGGFSGPAGDIPPVSHGPTGVIKYSLPNDSLPGGRQEGEMDPWTDTFQPWLQKIDEAFEHWDPETELCQPGDFTGPIGHLQQAVFRLTQNAGDDSKGGEKYGNAEIGAPIAYVDKWIQPGTPGAFDGEAVRAFDDHYGAARLRLVTGNQRELMIVLGLALTGEKQMWTKIHGDLATIMTGAVAAFADSGDAANPLEVLTALAGLAAVFATGTEALALGALVAGSGVVSAVLPKDDGESTPSEMAGGSADEVFTNMLEKLKTLATGSYEVERKLSKMLTDAADIAYKPSMRSSFHIDPESGLNSDFSHAHPITVHADLSVFRDIGYQKMPLIAAEMIRSADGADAADDLGPWIRDYTLGTGPYGAWQEWSDLHDVVTSVTTSSAKEIVLAGQKLAQFAGYLHDTDGDSQAALGKLAKKISDAPTGWKIHDSTPPPTPIRLPGGKVLIE